MSIPTASKTPFLPKTHRALHFSSTSSPLTVQNLLTPHPGPGSATVHILVASILSYSRYIYNGARQYSFPTPFVPGATAIGRIAFLGHDATSLKVGDLVHVDIMNRARDDPSIAILSGIHDGGTEGGRKLMDAEWRDGTYAEFAKVPLECLTVLDEKRLCGEGEGGLGYKIEELNGLSTPLVPYGGLRDVGLQAGETVIVAPGTGNFGQAAVRIALAMGATVVAVGRSEEKLAGIKNLDPKRIATVPITGHVEADTKALKAYGPINVYLDISPPEAAQSTHIKSCILALKQGARVSLMGGIRGDVGVPYTWIMRNNIQLRGKWMYEREDITLLVKMAEKGLFELKGGKVKAFGLEDWDEAFTAAEGARLGENVVFVP